MQSKRLWNTSILNYHNIYYKSDEIHDKLPRSEFINNNNIVFTQSYGEIIWDRIL